MNIKIKAAALLSGVGLLLATVTEADASTVRVRCEKRANRSVISVDGNDLVPGSYRCKVISGSNKARTALQDTLEHRSSIHAAFAIIISGCRAK